VPGFQGTFRLPFVRDGEAFYLGTDGFERVQPAEYSLGYPMVRLELTLW
jgi:hypothetical protein